MSYLYNHTSYAAPEYDKDFTTAYSLVMSSTVPQYTIEPIERLEADRLLSSPTLIRNIIETHKQTTHKDHEAPSYGSGKIVLQSMDPLNSSTSRVFNFENTVPSQTNQSDSLAIGERITSLGNQQAQTSPSPLNGSGVDDLGIQIPVRVPTFGEINEEEHSPARERISKSLGSDIVKEKVESGIGQQQQVTVEIQSQTISEKIRPEILTSINEENKEISKEKQDEQQEEDDFELELERRTAAYTLKLREKILASEIQKEAPVAEKPRKTQIQSSPTEIKKEVTFAPEKIVKTSSWQSQTETKPKKNVQQVTLDLRPYIQFCNTEPDYPTDLSDSLYAGVFNKTETQELKRKESVKNVSNERNFVRDYIKNITQSVRKTSKSPGNKSPSASYYRPVSTEKKNISSNELNSSFEKATQRNLAKVYNTTQYNTTQVKRTERSSEGKKSSYLSNLHETPRDLKPVSQSRPKSPQVSTYPISTRQQQQEKNKISELISPKRKSSSTEKTSYINIKDNYQVKRKETPQRYSDMKRKTSPRGYVVQTEPDMNVNVDWNKDSTALYKIVDNPAPVATFRQEDYKNYYHNVLKKKIGDTPSRIRAEANKSVPHEKPFSLYTQKDYSMKYSFHNTKCPTHGSQTPESMKADTIKFKAFI